MRFVRALPGTLGVFAIVFFPVAVAVFNLGAGLAHLDAARSAEPDPRSGESKLVGRYVASPDGDDRIELVMMRATGSR
jgi:hypothetical protein